VYRCPSSSLSSGNSNNPYHPNAVSSCYPVIGISSSQTSSKVVSDILLQFHQETESIDLLGTNTILNDSSNDVTSFLQKYKSQYKELLVQQQRQQLNELQQPSSSLNINNKTDAVLSSNTHADVDNHDDTNDMNNTSHSSSMMMMSMNSSTTSFMSP
jgi:hypothetical protein